MTKTTDDFDFLSTKNKEAIRKAYRAGRRTIEIGGRKFNIERGQGVARPFIMILPVNGMLPMAQVEVTNGSSSKLQQVKVLGKKK